jgi:hypothetical protein
MGIAGREAVAVAVIGVVPLLLGCRPEKAHATRGLVQQLNTGLGAGRGEQVSLLEGDPAFGRKHVHRRAEQLGPGSLGARSRSEQAARDLPSGARSGLQELLSDLRRIHAAVEAGPYRSHAAEFQLRSAALSHAVTILERDPTLLCRPWGDCRRTSQPGPSGSSISERSSSRPLLSVSLQHCPEAITWPVSHVAA